MVNYMSVYEMSIAEMSVEQFSAFNTRQCSAISLTVTTVLLRKYVSLSIGTFRQNGSPFKTYKLAIYFIMM